MSNDTANDFAATPFEKQAEIQRIIVWTMKAASEHVDTSHFFGEAVDPEVCMGLHQSFKAEFCFDRLRAWGMLDMAFMVWSQTFKNTVQLMDAKARQVATIGATVEAGTVKLASDDRSNSADEMTAA